jgi:hypothetical protein
MCSATTINHGISGMKPSCDKNTGKMKLAVVSYLKL